MTDTEQQITALKDQALRRLTLAIGADIGPTCLEAARYVLDTCMRVEEEWRGPAITGVGFQPDVTVTITPRDDDTD